MSLSAISQVQRYALARSARRGAETRGQKQLAAPREDAPEPEPGPPPPPPPAMSSGTTTAKARKCSPDGARRRRGGVPALPALPAGLAGMRALPPLPGVPDVSSRVGVVSSAWDTPPVARRLPVCAAAAVAV